jgi:hypothetical protein
MTEIEGKCLCGEIKYVTPTSPRYIFNCHCTICRHRSGSPFTTWLLYKTQDVTITEEKLSFFESNLNVMRGFCSKCGVDISWKNKEKSKWIGLTLGTCNDPNILKPTADIWINSKLKWVKLDPDIDKYPKGPFENTE